MPSSIILVHNEAEFRSNLLSHLLEAGHDVLGFSDPLRVLDALGAGVRARLLITGVIFPPATLHGVALARMVRTRRRDIAVLFLAPYDFGRYIDGLGGFIATPVGVETVVEAVNRLMPLNRPAGCPDEPKRAVEESTHFKPAA